MSVGFVASGNPAVVGLVRRVDVTVLFAVATVGESPLAAAVFAFEWLLT